MDHRRQERVRRVQTTTDGIRSWFAIALRPDDVAWASELLGRLDDGQWQDAFRAGGYTSADAARFIRTLKRRIADGRRLAATAMATPHKGG